MPLLARTPVLPIVRNTVPDKSRTLFRNVTWSAKKGYNSVLFQAPRTYLIAPLSCIFIRSYSSLFPPSLSLSRLRKCLASIPLWLFFFFFSLFSLSTSGDRRNDPLMENATVKEERLLSLTRTSSPADSFLYSFLCPIPHPLPSPALPTCLSFVLVHSLFCFFFGEENPLSLLVARRVVLALLGICFRFIKSRLYLAGFANRCAYRVPERYTCTYKMYTQTRRVLVKFKDPRPLQLACLLKQSDLKLPARLCTRINPPAF